MVNFTELTLKKIEKILASIKEGASIEKACKGAGLSRPTFYEWLHDSKGNQERYQKLIDSRSLVVEDALFNTALKGNVTAQIFWLKNRMYDKWSDKQETQHSGEVTLTKRILDFDEEE